MWDRPTPAGGAGLGGPVVRATCAPGFAGPPTTATWTPRPRSPRTPPCWPACWTFRAGGVGGGDARRGNRRGPGPAPRLYSAASVASISGASETAIGCRLPSPSTPPAATTASRPAGAVTGRPSSELSAAGRVERCLEICTDVAAQPGWIRILGLVLSMWVLTALGRARRSKNDGRRDG